MKHQIDVLRNIRLDLNEQVGKLPPVARLVAPEQVRKVEHIIGVLGAVISELESINVDSKQ